MYTPVRIRPEPQPLSPRGIVTFPTRAHMCTGREVEAQVGRKTWAYVGLRNSRRVPYLVCGPLIFWVWYLHIKSLALRFSAACLVRLLCVCISLKGNQEIKQGTSPQKETGL